MRAVELPRPLARPQEVGGARVPVAGRRVASHERLLVVEQERLVARPDVDLVDDALVAEVDADRLHEPQRATDLARDSLVAPSLERARDELLVPGVHLRQVGEAALREGAQQVERGDGLVVRLHHPLRIGHPGLGRRLVRVDRVAAERRELDALHALRERRAGLRELPCDATDLDDRQRRAVRQDRGHLQEHLEALPDRDRGDVAERLCAVACLEEERPPLDRLAEGAAERARLAGEDERRQLPEPLADGLDRGWIGPLRLLQGGQRAPRRRCPWLGDRHAAECSGRRFDASRRSS